MQMLTKFESKSSRAKGIAFHPTQPWLLTSLHNGTIQLWDYRMGTLLERFDGHDGPVRGIAFHPTQPLFVSGGDDYKVNVWNYKTKKLLFSLCGHMDYVRVCTFHHEYPWILSCSDDQTIRIWNWQSRNCIAILTGHSHYVMCAAFHPKEDLIVSASLDQTVRVWDISGLRKKHATPISLSLEDQLTQSHSSISNDLFGSTDAVVKFVLEGHDRGVNWCAFHPTLPLIISAGDDRLVKLWRMTASKAWQVDTCRGHYNNVSCCIFHPYQDLILSVSEDKTLRVWDLNRRVAVKTFRRENDRFWFITCHPKLNLFATGHDSGVMVFKLERERPAYALNINTLFYVNKEKSIVSYDLMRGTSNALDSVKELGSSWIPPRTLSYNPAEKLALVTSTADEGTYELVGLSNRNKSDTNIRDKGDNAIFVARNRFVVFKKEESVLELKDLSNKTTKVLQVDSIKPNDICYAGVGNILLFSENHVCLYDLQRAKITNSLKFRKVKYAAWSHDNSQIALLSKHYIKIVTKDLKEVTTIHETIRIKSAIWQDNNILLYTTLDHLKFALLSGDTGIIQTLESTVYLTKVKGSTVYALTRSAEPITLEIDPTEYLFKLALLKKDYEKVLQLFQTSDLIGQSIISYLQKKGYPEIALQFVEDPSTRFELALECGNMSVALDLARTIDRPEVWSRLASESLNYGNHRIAEVAYQKLRNFERLSFLYLTTGNQDKLQKMAAIAEKRGDYLSTFHNSLYTNDAEQRVRLLVQCNMKPLAYLTAKSNGLEEIANEILAETDMTEDKIKMPTLGARFTTPTVVKSTFEENWPLKSSSEATFERLLQEKMEQLIIQEPMDMVTAGESEDEFQDTEQALSDDEEAEALEQDEEQAEDGWEVEDIPLDEELVAITADDASAVNLEEVDLWKRNSPLAADHIAAGDFEGAMKALNQQVGAVNFAPLKDRFLEIFQAARVYAPMFDTLEPLTVYLRRNKESEFDRLKTLPFIARNYSSCEANELSDAYRLFKENKITEARELFIKLIHILILTVAEDKEEAENLSTLIDECRSYVVALSCELARREMKDEDAKRALELSVLFAAANMQPVHSTIALRLAINLAHKQKNFKTAAFLGKRLLEITSSESAKQAANRAILLGDRNPHDEVELDIDFNSEIYACAASLSILYPSSSQVTCPLCGAAYLPKYAGQLCCVCKVSNVGATARGRRFF